MIAAVALVACKKDGNKQGEAPGPDKITLLSDALVNVGEESEIITIKFTSNVDWTAEVEGGDFIALKENSGKAGDNIELKATIQSLPEEKLGRVGGVYIGGGEAERIAVVIMQGKVFFFIPEALEVGVEGGTVDFQVVTNLEYEVKIYDTFDWAPATYDKETGKGSFTVAANNGYDARSAYVKFTIPAIQDPVLDPESGDPTGETTDHVERIYVSQPGKAQVEWQTLLSDTFNVGDGANASVAMFGDQLLVCDGKTVHTVNPANGSFTGTLETGELPVQCIANDDAGNVLFANLGSQEAVFFNVYAVKAGSSFDAANAVHLIKFVNDAWSGSSGIDKVAARGDVFGNGIVTAMYGGVISYGGLSYCLYWTITNGKAAESYYNEWNPVVNNPDKGWEFTTPELADDLWCSNRAAFVAAGPSASDGFFYGGYDGLYNVNYYNGSEWSIAIEAAGDWAGGPQGMHATVWDGKNILVVAQMGYVWWAEGWGMDGFLWVTDVTNPGNVQILSRAVYGSPEGQMISGDTENSSVDVLPVVDGTDLVVYFVDTSHGFLAKIRFPKL